MGHIDEHTLELLALGDAEVRKSEKQIKRHLEAGPKTRVCEGEGGSRGLYRWSP